MSHAFFAGPWIALAFAVVCAGCDAPVVAAELTPEAPASASSTVQAAPGTTSAPGATKAEGANESLANQKFGEAIVTKEETLLADIAKAPSDFAGKTVRTTGTVKAVCKKAGCWMEIGDDTSRAHIKMANHAFVVPRRADGHTATIEGTVNAGAPQNECGSKDSCGGEDNGALAKVEIVATGVEFVD